MRNIDIIIANPAGNVTAFVLSPVEQEDYQAIGASLLNNPAFKIEQVGFVKEFSPSPRLEMCGMEFCGNAGRAFGFLCALKENIRGQAFVYIAESGCDHKLLVNVNVATQESFIEMPLPINIIRLKETGISVLDDAILVDFDGIMHVVLENSMVEPSMDLFEIIKDYVLAAYNPPAIGVMFVNSDRFINPYVYVQAVDSTFIEGSCGSGTTACAIAWSRNKSDGDFEYLVKQPAGELHAYIRVVAGEISKISIGGNVELGELINIDLDI